LALEEDGGFPLSRQWFDGESSGLLIIQKGSQGQYSKFHIFQALGHFPEYVKRTKILLYCYFHTTF